jgi:uncharacterized membrane protein
VRRLHVFALIAALLFSGCSLAEDVTPPPALATTQVVKTVASPTEGIPSPTAQAIVERAATEPVEDPTTTSQGVPSMGTIRGRLVNGTTGDPLATGIEVHLVGFDGQALALSESTTTDPVGKFAFDNLEIVPDRIFGAYAEYHGVEYFSEGRYFSDDEAVIDLLVSVYEATSDTRTIHIDRLHLIFDFTVEGLVEVLEVWVLSNQGDQTVAFLEGQEGIEFILPSGFSDLRFYDEMTSEGRFFVTDRGFYDRGPLRPIEGAEIIFSFALPFKGSLDFAQLMSFPVSATVILMPVNGPEVDANGLQDLGVGDIGGTKRRTYSLGPISVGETIELRLSGEPQASGGEGTQIGLIIGAALFGAALIVGGLWWYRIRVRDGAQEVAVAGIPNDREDLLRAIADLDDRFEAGRVPEDEYRRRRQNLKRQLMDLMREAHD